MKLASGIAYQSVGGGPPLVLLHAFPFDGRMWQQTAAALAAVRTVIVPDMRGVGQSDLPAGGFSIADLADDVAALLTELGFDNAGVGGLSMGGYVALAFAQRHRARLSELILCDTKAAPDSPEARKGREDAIALVQKEGVAVLRDRQIPRLVAASANEVLRAQVRSLATDRPDGVVAAIRALRDRPDRRAELAQIACPTLVVVGQDDVLSTPAEVREMASQIPGARLAEIPHAGHLSNLENPDAFSGAILEFLRK